MRYWLMTLILALPSAAQEAWTLTTSDFATQQVKVLALDEKGARVMPFVGGDEIWVPAARLLAVQRDAKPATPGGPFVASLIGGDRLAGEPVSLTDEQLVWSNPAIGKITVPLQRLSSVVRPDAAAQRPQEDLRQDLVLLANGDRVSGILSAVEAGQVTLQTDEGPISVSTDAIAAIHLAAVATPPRNTKPGFRLRLSDGSIVTVAGITLGGDSAQVTLSDGQQREVSAKLITGIEQVNGPVQWLSALEPAASEQVPFLGPSWPTRTDRGVTGESIRFGDRTFARGIGVHSRSLLTYELSGDHAAFRTQYAIDGPWPYADVTVRIKLDDKVVHETTGFRAGVVHPVVLIPLGDAKQLTLEVDYGGGYDVQDRFNWIEPALLRNMPAPATQSAGG